MGYESKLYVVDKHHWKWSNESWGEVVASFDLCKVYNLDFKKYPLTDCYIYADDGNTEIREDYYRRYQPCLSLLKGFNPNDWEDLVVLHYGH